MARKLKQLLRDGQIVLVGKARGNGLVLRVVEVDKVTGAGIKLKGRPETFDDNGEVVEQDGQKARILPMEPGLAAALSKSSFLKAQAKIRSLVLNARSAEMVKKRLQKRLAKDAD